MPVIGHSSADLDVQALGKPAVLSGSAYTSARLSALLSGVLKEIERDRLIAPALCYEVVAVAKTSAGTITLDGGERLHAPLLAHRMARASHLLFGVATIGGAMAKTVRQCFTGGKNVKAILLEELANAALFETANRLQSLADERASDMGSSSSGPMSPGDVDGFGLDQQATVVTLAGAEKIGVTLTGSGQMNPVHSLSVVIGLGKSMRKWTKMDDCKTCRSRETCRHYQRTFEAAA